MRELIVGKPALLVIDMQRDFLEPGAGCYAPGGERIVPAIAAVLSAARAAGIPVIFTQEAHRPGRVDSGRELDPGTGASYPGGLMSLSLSTAWKALRASRSSRS